MADSDVEPDYEVEKIGLKLIPAHELELRDEIVRLRHQVELMDAAKGSLNSGSIRTILGIVGLAMSLTTGLATMWLNNATEPTRTSLGLLEAQVTGIDTQLEKDENKLSVIDEKIEELQTKQNNALTTEDLESRFSGIDAAMLTITEQYERADTALEGRFTRTVGRRLEPRIEQDEKQLEDVIKRLNKHLQEK